MGGIAWLVVLWVTAGVATAQATSFVTVDDVLAAASQRTEDSQALFFPLDDSFADCAALTAPCPSSSSSLLLVPAQRRTIGWASEGSDLPRDPGATGGVRAIGIPPADAAGATYLLPALDGAGAALRFLPHRLDGDRFLAGTGNGDVVVPRLEGPALSTAAPTGDAPARILDEPSVVGDEVLDDGVPVLLARRAAPSRVVFGILPDPAWAMDAEYVPLLDDDVVAVLTTHEDELGLAVPVTPATTPGSAAGSDTSDDGRDEADRQGDAETTDASGSDTERREGDDMNWVVVVAAAVAAATTALVLAVRRSRRTRSSVGR